MITQEEVKEYLGQLITDAMYMEPGELDDDQLFSDFGLESITLVKILEKMSDKYSYHILVKDVLPHQTLKAASSFIYEKVNAQNT